MQEALIFMGTVNRQEVYQLLIGEDYISHYYNGVLERQNFYDNASKEFANMILNSKPPLKVLIANGFWINQSTKKHESIQKLEERLKNEFYQLVVNKLNANGLSTLPPESKN